MRINVVAALIKDKNKIFVARRASGNLVGYWEFPGGKIEGNETQNQAIVREIDEEFGIIVKPIKSVQKYRYQYDFGIVQLELIECEINSKNQPTLSDGSR